MKKEPSTKMRRRRKEPQRSMSTYLLGYVRLGRLARIAIPPYCTYDVMAR